MPWHPLLTSRALHIQHGARARSTLPETRDCADSPDKFLCPLYRGPHSIPAAPIRYEFELNIIQCVMELWTFLIALHTHFFCTQIFHVLLSFAFESVHNIFFVCWFSTEHMGRSMMHSNEYDNLKKALFHNWNILASRNSICSQWNLQWFSLIRLDFIHCSPF